MDKSPNLCTVLLLDGSKIERKIRQYNGAYYVIYLGNQIPVARNQVVEGSSALQGCDITAFPDPNKNHCVALV